MRTRTITAVAVVACLGLLASCGDARDDDQATDPTGGVGEQAQQLGQDVLVEPDAEPRQGGSLRYGLEAETDGWDPTTNRWAVSGVTVGMAVFDPLAAVDDDGLAHPYLAESIEPNDDHTAWTITLREGVTFHDGTPLTSEAVKRTLDAHLASALTAPAMGPLQEVVVIDERTVEARTEIPWVAFPQLLVAQVGVIPAPSMLDAADGGRRPVGTGPFAFVRWVPGAELVVDRNPDYWRTDEDGQPLPRLDRVTFTAIPEAQSRVNALVAGDVDVIHHAGPTQIAELERIAQRGEIQLRNDRSAPEKGFVMFNLAQPPFDDPAARRALVLATDVDAYNATINAGAVRRARSFFTPESPFFSEAADEAWPEYDLDAAREALAEYEAEHGPLRVELTAPPTPEGRSAAQLLQSQWADIGVETTVTSLEQTAYILAAVQGTYQAILWRQYGAPDPDTDAHWFLSENAASPPGIGLNFARIEDPEVDEALLEGRTNPDGDARIEAYQRLSERFNELQPFLWVSYTRWVIAARPNVHHFWNGALPDGSDPEPIQSGVIRLTHTWRS